MYVLPVHVYLYKWCVSSMKMLFSQDLFVTPELIKY